MAGRIFINYRRGDDPGFTQALLGRLEQAFSEDQLFMDVEDIAPGLDFVEVLNEQVAQCDVLLAMIGRGWVDAVDDDGTRRLDNPDDFVRIEIESALKQKKRVIPVLVNDAKMPRLAELPESLHAFARCNAVRLSHERFRADAQDLIKSLKDVLTAAEETRRAEAKARREAARLRPARERPEPIAEVPAAEIAKREPREGIAAWIASLPSGVAWYIPLGVLGVFLLGWMLPGSLFSMKLGWGAISLLYGIAGAAATAIAIYSRRALLGGAELALYWYAAFSVTGILLASAISLLGLRGIVRGDWIALAAAAVSALVLVWLRRRTLAGLEASIYWLGLSMAAFWALLLPLGSAAWVSAWSGSLASPKAAIETSGLFLASAIGISAAAILLLRLRKFSGPELSIYLMGTAAAFVAVALLP